MIIGITGHYLNFSICKSCQKCWYLHFGTQNNQLLFLLIFSDVTLDIQTFPTSITFTTLSSWLFTWKSHLMQCNVKSVEKFLRRNENNKTPTKKHLIFIFNSRLDISIFRHLLSNLNLKLMASFPNNHYLGHTFLNTRALKTIGQ